MAVSFAAAGRARIPGAMQVAEAAVAAWRRKRRRE